MATPSTPKRGTAGPPNTMPPALAKQLSQSQLSQSQLSGTQLTLSVGGSPQAANRAPVSPHGGLPPQLSTTSMGGLGSSRRDSGGLGGSMTSLRGSSSMLLTPTNGGAMTPTSPMRAGMLRNESFSGSASNLNYAGSPMRPGFANSPNTPASIAGTNGGARSPSIRKTSSVSVRSSGGGSGTRRSDGRRRRHSYSYTSETDSALYNPFAAPRNWKIAVINNCVYITLLVQMLILMAFFLLDSANCEQKQNANKTVCSKGFNLGVVIVSFAMQTGVIGLVGLTAVKLLKDARARSVPILSLLNTYAATTLSFAGIYFLMVSAIDRSAFKGVPWSTSDIAPFGLFLDTIYFSFTTITTVGFGDISPNRVYSIIVTCIQQLISVWYSAIVFSMGITHFQGEDYGYKAFQLSSDKVKRTPRGSIMRDYNGHPIPLSKSDDSKSSSSSYVPPETFLYRVQVFLARYCLLITCLLQGLVMVLLFGNDINKSSNSDENVDTEDISTSGNFIWTVTVMAAIQVACVTLVVSTSMKLIQDVRSKSFSTTFLISSFLSTTLSFAGIYTLLNRVAEGNVVGLEQFAGVGFTNRAGDDMGEPLSNLAKMLSFSYFSNTVMTTVGYGDILPVGFICRIVVVVQQLVSVMYSTLIFSAGVQ